MARRKTSEPRHVYQGVNHTKGEIYHGVSKEPEARIDGSHCEGNTKAIAHWDCKRHDIEWSRVSTHETQPEASAEAHQLERLPPPKGYKHIKTAGI